jgi:hypothetical protein
LISIANSDDFIRRIASDLNYMKQVQNDQDDRNNDQGMDPTASLRDPWTDVRPKITEQPQDQQNDDDSPQHEISPYKRYEEYAMQIQPAG